MFSVPATTLAARIAFVFAMLALTCNAFALDSRETPTQLLQDLGVQIKLASDKTDVGRPPTMTDVAYFEQTLSALGEAAYAAPGSPFQRKHQAISLLFAKLKYQTTHPQSAPERTAMSRAQLDVEVVSSKHGTTCETALGISESLPVKVTLAQRGSAGNDVWFHFEAGAAGHFRFQTDANGADPLLRIFRGGCAADAISIAENDDNFGLDAAASVAAADHTTLLVHVINSGEAGSIKLIVQDVDGTISGKVTNAATGLPIEAAQVSLFSSNGNYLGVVTNTDPSGNYSLAVNAGTYYVRVSANQYVSELYPNAQCGYNSFYYYISNCAVAQAQTISVAGGAAVSNVDVALSAGQRISGVVRDNANLIVPSSMVTMYDGAGSQLANIYTDSFGRYSFSTLPAGSYKLAAQANGYGSQMFDHAACTGPLQTQCDLSHANTVAISSQDFGGASFNLPVLATIQGNIGSPGFQPGFNAQVSVLDAVGNVVAQASPDSSGHYRAGPLPIGSYNVYVTAGGFFSQIFNAIDCAQDCYSSIASAQAIAISQDGQVGVADFQLTPLPPVHGHIQDAVSGLPLANVTVQASITPPIGFYGVSSATSDSNGNYTLRGTGAGRYYLWAQSDDHVDQVYSGISCEVLPNYYPQYAPCDVSGATLLTIAPGQTPPAFDFVLQPSSGISGHAVIRAGPGSDLPALVQVNVYNSAGAIAGAVTSDSLGNYFVSDLPAGTYFVSAGSYSNQYVTQIWQMMDCPNVCAATTGTPVVVGQGTVVPGIDFLLTRRDAVVGRVTNSLGAPIAGVLIDLFDSTSHNFLTTAATDAQGYYAAGWNLGYSYLVSTEAGHSFIDQVYSGISCPLGPAYFGLCPLTNATPVGLSYGSSQPHIANFVLQSNDPIFANGFE